MLRVAQGDTKAFRTLSEGLLPAIYTYASRLLRNDADAQDVAQETFLRVWLNARNYEPKARVSTWVHSIARNLAIDKIRKSKRRGDHFELDAERDAAPASDRPSQLLEKKLSAQAFQDALSLLPERQQSALLLRHEQGLSQSEIAVVLACSIDSVESLLKRARQTLKEQLVTNNPDHSGE